MQYSARGWPKQALPIECANHAYTRCIRFAVRACTFIRPIIKWVLAARVWVLREEVGNEPACIANAPNAGRRCRRGTFGAPLEISAAERYPSHPVKIVVPFAAGGSIDFVARVAAKELSATLGQSFVVGTAPARPGRLASSA